MYVRVITLELQDRQQVRAAGLNRYAMSFCPDTPRGFVQKNDYIKQISLKINKCYHVYTWSHM
jgi:hypothetical protein